MLELEKYLQDEKSKQHFLGFLDSLSRTVEFWPKRASDILKQIVLDAFINKCN